jgi:hypothetical protein
MKFHSIKALNLLTACFMGLPVYASNPLDGDEQGARSAASAATSSSSGETEQRPMIKFKHFTYNPNDNLFEGSYFLELDHTVQQLAGYYLQLTQDEIEKRSEKQKKLETLSFAIKKKQGSQDNKEGLTSLQEDQQSEVLLLETEVKDLGIRITHVKERLEDLAGFERVVKNLFSLKIVALKLGCQDVFGSVDSSVTNHRKTRLIVWPDMRSDRLWLAKSLPQAPFLSLDQIFQETEKMGIDYKKVLVNGQKVLHFFADYDRQEILFENHKNDEVKEFRQSESLFTLVSQEVENPLIKELANSMTSILKRITAQSVAERNERYENEIKPLADLYNKFIEVFFSIPEEFRKNTEKKA